MNNIWFTADTHFNHTGIIGVKNRVFNTVNEMNKKYIEMWNDVVKHGDRIYHLGDFAFGDLNAAIDIMKQLKGQIYLIRGNHDNIAETMQKKLNKFIWLKDYHYLDVNGQKIALCHYPFLTWRNMHHGAWHLHGHCHGNLEETDYKRIDCDIATNGGLVGYEEVKLRMECKGQYIALDHHE